MARPERHTDFEHACTDWPPDRGIQELLHAEVGDEPSLLLCNIWTASDVVLDEIGDGFEVKMEATGAQDRFLQ